MAKDNDYFEQQFLRGNISRRFLTDIINDLDEAGRDSGSPLTDERTAAIYARYNQYLRENGLEPLDNDDDLFDEEFAEEIEKDENVSPDVKVAVKKYFDRIRREAALMPVVKAMERVTGRHIMASEYADDIANASVGSNEINLKELAGDFVQDFHPKELDQDGDGDLDDEDIAMMPKSIRKYL